MTKEFTALATNKNIVLCEKTDGAFLNIRSPEDLKNLQDLVNSLIIVEVDTTTPALFECYVVVTDSENKIIVKTSKGETYAQEYAGARPGLKVVAMRQIPDDEL